MDETFFEFLERTRTVDRILFWLAVISPLAVATGAALLRNSSVLTRKRHRWVLGILVAPALLLMWTIYNRVVDHFGLDSLAGLLVNIAVFAAAAFLATGLRLLLRALLQPPPVSLAAASTDESGEFRPYKPTLTPLPGTIKTISGDPPAVQRAGEELDGS